MESIGEKLKKAREAKKLTVKDVAKDTNIASTYIEALENEEFEKFPGETYVIGFFRSYSEYLKLDAEEIIQAYKGYKIGESATPLEELTRPTRPGLKFDFSSFFQTNKNLVYILGGIFVVLLFVFLIKGISNKQIEINDEIKSDSVSIIKQENSESLKENKTEVKTIEITNDKGSESISSGEVAQFLLGSKTFSFFLKEIGDNKITMEFLHNKSNETLSLNEIKNYKFADYDREFSLKLKAVTENRAKINVVLGKKLGTSDAVDPNFADAKDNKARPSNEVIAQNKNSLKIILEADFIAKTYLELYIDGQKKTSGIIPAGTHQRWEATGFIQVKIGNAGGMRAKINDKEYIFGPTGTVAHKIIKWKKDPVDPNKYHIVVKDW